MSVIKILLFSFSFLQDAGQVQLRLPTDISNHQKLTHLAQLYSLKMEADDGITVLTKTRYVLTYTILNLMDTSAVE